ncbi:unnamed protein product [Rotaria sp. Silwood2]|nr:unnamed protein product [Rotaria sp. Silwood2]CAF2511998.1 unnamed protein product [Rotaria sp. Silwood2]CAF2888945.1 unnamed protein product [Rotaria sp. Silwood2]CAF3866888.1 unnamed protein product [Rotaria sp. Silwood2]CAF3902104.1 unnamed protein product [Rotaria sp. Silwood2]
MRKTVTITRLILDNMAARNFQRSRGDRDASGNSNGKLIQLSKSLSWLLRHAVLKEGLEFQPDGYVLVDDVLKHRSFANKYTIDDIHQCVATNEKKRFGLKIDEATGKEMIRAHQGHSLEEADIAMKEITDPNEYPTVLHGTYMRHWPSIRDKGLSKMNRTRIHFAPGLPKQSGVISGMRSNAELYIYIDMEKALKDGFKFFVSNNNVILCSGNENGFIPPRYFRLVENRHGEQLSLPIDSFKTKTSNE